MSGLNHNQLGKRSNMCGLFRLHIPSSWFASCLLPAMVVSENVKVGVQKSLLPTGASTYTTGASTTDEPTGGELPGPNGRKSEHGSVCLGLIEQCRYFQNAVLLCIKRHRHMLLLELICPHRQLFTRYVQRFAFHRRHLTEVERH